MAAQTDNVGWWMNLLSDTTRYGASLWERYFGASSPSSSSGLEITSSGGKTNIVVGKLPWLLIGGGALLLVVVCGFFRSSRRKSSRR